MNVLTLKIPEDLDAALQRVSRGRGLSKSAVVREALEASLGRHADDAAAAERWVAQWRGRLVVPTPASAVRSRRAGRSEGSKRPSVPDARLAHLLAKHLR